MKGSVITTKRFGTYNTEWQISHSICAKIRSIGVFQRKCLEIWRPLGKWKGGEIIKGEVCLAPIHLLMSAAQKECVGMEGISERKKCVANLSKMGI